MLCTWFEHVKIKIAVQAGLLKYANQIVVAQKRPGRSKKMWDEMLVDEIKKLGMDSSDHQNLFESLETKLLLHRRDLVGQRKCGMKCWWMR